MNDRDFQELVWREGDRLYRDMPWRRDTSPYYVMVSELMLQQTQVERVIPKFQAFIAQFPTVRTLADASLQDVLISWSGLGYNRRAKFLHGAAKMIIDHYDGEIPSDIASLVTLPGIGPNTAGAIRAYGFNLPAVFIETNVRTVYFAHYFHDTASVSDKELQVIVDRTVDQEHPRQWYWAMMDYGAFLKRNGQGLLDKSRHYKKQAPLKGSLREVRGMILKRLAQGPAVVEELKVSMPDDDRYEKALAALLSEGMISESRGVISLSA